MRKTITISLSEELIERITDTRDSDPEFNLSRRIEKLLDRELD
jgi:hypothetical protein|tara:strand:+ start:445 stop:573 length:129 start_codon:yes stop_codon:yes gene_type:complete